MSKAVRGCSQTDSGKRGEGGRDLVTCPYTNTLAYMLTWGRWVKKLAFLPDSVRGQPLGTRSSEKNFSGVHTLEKSYLAVNFATLTTAMFLAPKVGNIKIIVILFNNRSYKAGNADR